MDKAREEIAQIICDNLIRKADRERKNKRR